MDLERKMNPPPVRAVTSVGYRVFTLVRYSSAISSVDELAMAVEVKRIHRDLAPGLRRTIHSLEQHVTCALSGVGIECYIADIR